MKKKIISVLLAFFLLFPFGVKASGSYVSQNLEEALKAEGIEYDLSDYKETDDQIPIYFFRGSGCTHCYDFLNFLNTIVHEEYGKMFKVVAYEVWYNKENASLLKEVGNFLGEDTDGVPFIIIGDKSFVGYGDSLADSIKETIKQTYNDKNRYDVFKEMEKAKKKEKNANVPIIIWNGVIVSLFSILTLVFVRQNHKKVIVELEEIKEKMNRFEKEPVKKEKKEVAKKKK